MNPSTVDQQQSGTTPVPQSGADFASAIPTPQPVQAAPTQQSYDYVPQPIVVPGVIRPGQQQAAPPPPPAAILPALPPVPQPQQPVVKSPGVKPAATNPNSTQNMLQIAEIRDGIVIMNDGSFRSVVMVRSINFDLMSQQEQEAVEFSYQNLLNSLYFPIQIFIRSQKVDITPYLEKLDKIRSEHDNMLLALLMEDYITYITQIAQQTNIMDKKFYMVVPYFPHIDVQKALSQSKNFITGFGELFTKKEHHVTINEADLEKAKAELRNRIQALLSGLQQANIQAIPLDTQELIELYYDAYNPDTATRQQLKNFNQLNADIITKGQGVAPNPQLNKELV